MSVRGAALSADGTSYLDSIYCRVHAMLHKYDLVLFLGVADQPVRQVQSGLLVTGNLNCWKDDVEVR